MAELIDDVATQVGATCAILERVGKALDPRKIFWCNYPMLDLQRDELEEKVNKDTRKLEKILDEKLFPTKLWYIGVPKLKLIRRGISHLSCEIDLYYAASDNHFWCWYGKLHPKADKFEIPPSLINPLLDGLNKGQAEIESVTIVERAPGYTVYEYLGRDWKIPDAFLGFVWALKDTGRGFEGLLDPISCALMDKFTNELPSLQTPKLVNGSYEEIVDALRSLGWNKTEAEEKARYLVEKYPGVPLEEKIKYALSG